MTPTMEVSARWATAVATGPPGRPALRLSCVRMFVLGIDPGLSRCGYAVVEPAPRGRGRARALGVIRTDRDWPVPQRLAELQVEINALLDEYAPAVVAVERIFFQNNIRTAVGVAQASGLVLAAAAARRLAVAEYSPSEIKAVVAGDGRAEKRQVQIMVKTLLGLSALPRPADAADAAALALCHLAHDPMLRSARDRDRGPAGGVGQGNDRGERPVKVVGA